MYIKELCTSETGKLKDKIPKPFILFLIHFWDFNFITGHQIGLRPIGSTLLSNDEKSAHQNGLCRAFSSETYLF